MSNQNDNQLNTSLDGKSGDIGDIRDIRDVEGTRDARDTIDVEDINFSTVTLPFMIPTHHLLLPPISSVAIRQRVTVVPFMSSIMYDYERDK